MRSLLFIFLAGAVGFGVGFLVANSINRSEIDGLRAEAEAARQGPQSSVLSNEEIDARIAEADAKPEDFEFQKKLGVALYRYALIKQDSALLARAERLLDRAWTLRPDDLAVARARADANFDIGYLDKNNERLVRARSMYAAMLERDPRDAGLLTDHALTHFLADPPELGEAESGLRAAHSADARYEKPLEYLIQVLVRAGKRGEAAQMLERLRTANPSNQSIAGLDRLVRGEASLQ